MCCFKFEDCVNLIGAARTWGPGRLSAVALSYDQISGDLMVLIPNLSYSPEYHLTKKLEGFMRCRRILHSQ